jgi:hypothetical protein
MHSQQYKYPLINVIRRTAMRLARKVALVTASTFVVDGGLFWNNREQ